MYVSITLAAIGDRDQPKGHRPGAAVVDYCGTESPIFHQAPCPIYVGQKKVAF